MAVFKLKLIILWWHQVTVKPDLNKIIVFNKGIENGLNKSIPIGGQIIPVSISGANILWK